MLFTESLGHLHSTVPQQLLLLAQRRADGLQRAVNHLRVVGLAPRQAAVVAAQLAVEMEDAETGLLGDADDLLQQIGEVLDVAGLLAEEALVEHGGEGVVADLVGQRHQPLEVLEDALLDGEGLANGADRLDGVIGELDLGGLDVGGFAAAAALEVFFEPVGVGEGFDGGAFPEAVIISENIHTMLSSQTRRIRGKIYIQRETMQRDICARTISRQLAEEEPASQFFMDMASDRLQRSAGVSLT
ncbi:hypothetical protein VTN96DRAFT_2378 [Rasamsonia emersonii]